MCFEIREAVLHDLGPALRLDRECFGVDAWTFLDYCGVFSARGVKKFTALADGEFAGFAASEYDYRKKAVCMMTLAVCPEYRRRGIGTALLKKSEDAFPAKKCYLYVDAANETAIRLYEQLGYRRNGIEAAYYLNGHDAIVFTKMKGEK